MADRSDVALVRLTLEQGSQFYGNIVKRHSDYLFGLGMRLSSGQHALAKDVSQQAFIKAFKYLPSFNPDHAGLGVDQNKRFRNWLTGIAVNCYSDLAKAESRYVSVCEDHRELESTKERFSSGELREFSELIAPLTIEERQLITLRFVYEYTIEEIAGMLNLKKGTAKSKISRAVGRLREHTEMESEEEAKHE